MKITIKRIMDSSLWQKELQNTKKSIFLIVSDCLMVVGYHYNITLAGSGMLCFFGALIFIVTQLIIKQIHFLCIKGQTIEIHQNQDFIYHNKTFQDNQLKRIYFSFNIGYLEFKNEVLSFQSSRQIKNQLRLFYPKQFQAGELLYNERLITQLTYILLFYGMVILLNNVAGIFYCLQKNTMLIDISQLLGDLFILIMISVSLMLFKKFKKQRWTIGWSILFLAVFISIFSTGHIKKIIVNQKMIGYCQVEEGIQIYRDVAYVYGKKETIIPLEQLNDIYAFQNLICIEHDDQYTFYSLQSITQSLDDIYEKYDGYTYKNQTSRISIQDKVMKINDIECPVKVVGENILYTDALQTPLLIYLNHEKTDLNVGKCELFDLNTQSSKTLYKSYNTSIQMPKQDQETSDQDEVINEQPEVKEDEVVEPEVDPYMEKIEKEKAQKDQNNYQAYQEVIKKQDISSFESNQNVVKIHNESDDIYQVIKALDREYTRINNDKDTILDVQILSMLIYSQYDNQYGIYINRRVDSSTSESQTFSEVIVMKKYGNDYVGTRFYDSQYMPMDHPTNNGSYKTRQTTEYLYRIEGNRVGENAW